MPPLEIHAKSEIFQRMSNGASRQLRSHRIRSFPASCLFYALLIVAIGFAGFAIPKPAAAAAILVDCASMHAGPAEDGQRAAHPSDAASCCLFHCIPAVPLLATPVAEPVLASPRIRLGGNDPVRGVTPAIIVPPPRA